MGYPLAFWPSDLKTIIDILGGVVTAAAVVIGGIWAYFRFVKDRTYRPRLEVGLFGQWREVESSPMLHARVTVRNIGASKIELIQDGTGLAVLKLAETQPPQPDATAWESVTGFSILSDHEWIEPGETVSDDLLLNLGLEPAPLLFKCYLRWKCGSGAHDIIIVKTSKIIPVEGRLDGTESGGNEEEEEE